MNEFIENTFIASDVSRRIIRQQLYGFWGITFAITFGLALLYFVTDIGSNPVVFDTLFYIAVFAPTIAAIVMSFLAGGTTAVGNLFLMLIRRTNYVRWISVALLLLPGAWLVWWLIEYLSGTTTPVVNPEAIFTTMPMLLFTTLYVLQDPGPIGEELGLRGYALPRFLALFDPVKASFMMGLMHALWHTPAFFIASSGQADLSLAAFITWTIALNIIWTWIFIWSNGNVLISGMWVHLLFNVQGAAVVFPELQNIGLVTCITAIILVTFFPFRQYVHRQADG